MQSTATMCDALKARQVTRCLSDVKFKPTQGYTILIPLNQTCPKWIKSCAKGLGKIALWIQILSLTALIKIALWIQILSLTALIILILASVNIAVHSLGSLVNFASVS